MPTTLNVNEAKTNFSSVISNVETNRVTITIMRYGHPVARITPIKPRKRTLRRTDSRLAFKISDEDLFSDDDSRSTGSTRFNRTSAARRTRARA